MSSVRACNSAISANSSLRIHPKDSQRSTPSRSSAVSMGLSSTRRSSCGATACCAAADRARERRSRSTTWSFFPIGGKRCRNTPPTVGGCSDCHGSPRSRDNTMNVELVNAIASRTGELAGVPFEISYCPHPAGPPICWCRKPLPGLAVVFIERYQLDVAQCIYVGAGTQDPGFARRLGFQYRDADDFFTPSS